MFTLKAHYVYTWSTYVRVRLVTHSLSTHNIGTLSLYVYVCVNIIYVYVCVNIIYSLSEHTVCTLEAQNVYSAWACACAATLYMHLQHIIYMRMKSTLSMHVKHMHWEHIRMCVASILHMHLEHIIYMHT